MDGDGRSVGISGGTRPCGNLIAHCRGVDVLIHECTDVRTLPLNPGGGFPSLEVQTARLASHHTPSEQVGKVAARAGARTLVLWHLMNDSTPQALQATVARDFGGRIIVGEDLAAV